VLGVVANMVGFTCSHCGEIEHIFGEEGARVFADHLQLPLLATLPLKSTIRLAADNGLAIAHADDAIGTIFNHLAQTVSATFS
jgi:ATP-binding protein involved in chromosome partitioning